MNDLLPLLLTRRSVRRYTGDPIPPETLRAVVTAGLLSPSSRNRRPWRLVVVQDRATLEALSHCRQGSAQMLAGAGAAILVFARPTESDVWTEDCAILMSNLHLAAHSQGLGSCWIQGRLRQAEDPGPPRPSAGSAWPCRRTGPWRPSSPWASRRKVPHPTPWRRQTGGRSPSCEPPLRDRHCKHALKNPPSLGGFFHGYDSPPPIYLTAPTECGIFTASRAKYRTFPFSKRRRIP